ncbi:hypothetical protein [Acinetobacter venetianus]|uniref:hypothetical protein n=1 Tax=Acinetobacter venetianus TaxID=52133 RepID=UPI003F907C21
MKNILFILCTILATYTFAKTDAESSQEMCKTYEAMAEATQSLRQTGMKASEVTDKLLEASTKWSIALNKQADENSNKQKAEELKNIGSDLKKVMDDQALLLVQQAFEISIQPNKELKNKVIERFTNESYLSCISTLIEINHLEK